MASLGWNRQGKDEMKWNFWTLIEEEISWWTIQLQTHDILWRAKGNSEGEELEVRTSVSQGWVSDERKLFPVLEI